MTPRYSYLLGMVYLRLVGWHAFPKRNMAPTTTPTEKRHDSARRERENQLRDSKRKKKNDGIHVLKLIYICIYIYRFLELPRLSATKNT